jgi:phage-related protein
MVRNVRPPGETPLFWVGSAKRDLLAFPERVKDEIGVALSVAQFGGIHRKAKPWKGEGPGVFEVYEDYRGEAYRAVYTLALKRAIYVVHCFQKKTHKGIKTPQADVDLISQRLRAARGDHERRYGHSKEKT